MSAPRLPSSWRALLAHELRLLLYSPLTYIFLIGFSLALSSSVFLVADFYASDQASIRLLLVFLPWVALILVPALAMRSWTDDYDDRGVELMLTLPVRLATVVVVKFVAAFGVLLLALLLTAPFTLSVYYLGNPDSGKVLAGYLAMALLLGLFYAVAMLATALAREPVAAFVSAAALLFLLLLPGADFIAGLASGYLPTAALDLLAGLSPKTHYDSIASGLLRFENVFYFLLLGSAALLANGAVIRASQSGAKAWRRHCWTLVVALVGVAALSLALSLSADYDLSLDLTEQHEFTLSPGSREIVGELASNTEVTFYWNVSQSTVPTAIKSHARRVQRLLQRVAAAAAGRLRLTVVDPIADSDEELAALQHGIQRTPMSSGDHFYLGAAVSQGERGAGIPYFDLERDRHLEYDIVQAIASLQHQEVPAIGIVSPLLAPTALQQPRAGMAFLETLKRSYDVAVVPYFADQLPTGLASLVLLQPAVLKQRMLHAIDRFVMHGGSLVVVLDPYLRFDRAANELAFEPSAEIAEINDITDLLLHYGIRFHGEDIVGDRKLASPVATDERQLSYPYWLRVDRQSFNPAHPISATLNEVFFAEPGELTLPDDTGTALITTSDEAGSRPRTGYANQPPAELALEFAPDNRRRILAAIVEGPLTSALAAAPQSIDDGDSPARSSGHPRVVVVADSDWLFDPFALQVVEANGQSLTRPLNDNHALLLNLIEYASGVPMLGAIRARGQLNRPFTRVERLFKQAEQQYHTQEAELTGRVAAVESALQQVLTTAGVESLQQLPEPLAARAKQLRDDVIPLRKALRRIRHQIRARVERLGQRLLAVNLLMGPLLVLLLAAVVRFRRRRQHRLLS